MPYADIEKRRAAQKVRYYKTVKKQLQEDTQRRANYYAYMKEYKRKARMDGKIKISEKDKIKCKQWAKENREWLNAYYRKGNSELKDHYILDQLKKGTGISETELRKHPELIQAKRQSLLLTRQIKNNEASKNS